MPTSCCAFNCTSRQGKDSGISFFRIPKDVERKKKWLRALRRGSVNKAGEEWDPKGHERICGKHFVSGKASNDPKHPDYVPSLFDFPSTPHQEEKSLKSKCDRFERAAKRQKREPAVNTSEEEHTETPPGLQQDNSICETAVTDSELETTPTSETFDQVVQELREVKKENEKLKEHCRSLEKEVDFLRNERDGLHRDLTNNKLSSSCLTDKKCRFYTGLPAVQVFCFVASLVSDFIPIKRCISKRDQILLTLMKLRLGLANGDLAYRFHVSASTVSEVINNCIPVLASRLRFLIKWPSKDEVKRNLPLKFRKRQYSNCRVIIDCSEIFTERPYNLHARAKTWSNYKHHHTLKFLIGITPYGTVSFVSKCWGGRISDVDITARSGFYDKIEYGDMVMADRGFTISQELAMRGATLSMPPFVAGRKQLPGRVVQKARQISSLRIHVERAIERVKNYKILSQTLPLTLAPLASDIVETCSALTNFMPKLIK